MGKMAFTRNGYRLVVETFDAVLAFTAPHRCAACDVEIKEGFVFCELCEVSLEPSPFSASDSTIAPYLYGGELAVAVTRLKYHRRYALARSLAVLLNPCFLSIRNEVDLIVPVPLHPRRLAQRGFNQSALLARYAATTVALPVAYDALFRVRETEIQAHLPRDARARNVDGAFNAKAKRCHHRRIALIDDVITTGATTKACANVLIEAGAKSVISVALACANLVDREC